MRKLPGKVSASGTAGVDPKDYDLVGLAMQEPQYRSPGVRELLDAVARAKVPCMSIMNMPPLAYLRRVPGLDTDALKAAYTDASVWDNFDPARITLCSPDPQAIRPPEEKINVLQVTLPTNFKVARFPSEQHTAMLRQLQDEIDAIRFDTPEGKTELPVKLRVYDFDLRAACQMGDAARRQLSLRDQGRYAHCARGGVQRHRNLALGLQFRRRPLH